MLLRPPVPTLMSHISHLVCNIHSQLVSGQQENGYIGKVPNMTVSQRRILGTVLIALSFLAIVPLPGVVGELLTFFASWMLFLAGVGLMAKTSKRVRFTRSRWGTANYRAAGK